MYLTGHMMDGYKALCMDNRIYETVAHFGKQYAWMYETITHFGFKVYTVTYDLKFSMYIGLFSGHAEVVCILAYEF
jgi:hypothetical protein